MGFGFGMPSLAINMVNFTATTVTADDIFINATGTLDFGAGDVVLTHSANNLAFTGATLYTFDDGIVIGHTVGITAGSAADFQVLGTGPADSTALLGAWSADAVGPELAFVKSRAAALVTNTIVQDNDVVGRIVWYPADGADFATEAATFHAEVDDGSPAAGDVGMAFVWRAMPGGAGAIAEVLRLDAAGNLVAGVDDQGSLGTADIGWSDAYFASGAVLTFGAPSTPDLTITHSANTLTIAGGNWQLADTTLYLNTSLSSISHVSGGSLTITAVSHGGNGNVTINAINGGGAYFNYGTTADAHFCQGGGTAIIYNNLVIGATAAGATAAAVLALSNSATAPTTTVDLCQIYGADVNGAGTAGLAVYCEAAVTASGDVASTHTIPILYNGTLYHVLASNV